MYEYQRLKIFLLLFIVSSCLFGQSPYYSILPSLTPSYTSGFKTISIDNQANEFQRGASTRDEIVFDFWYPGSTTRKSRPLTFQYFFELCEDRLKKSKSDDYGTYTEELSAYLASFSENDRSDPSKIETATFSHTLPANNNFPLLLYFTSEYNLPFEQIRLFEYLSSRGFAIAVVGHAHFEVKSKSIDDILSEVNDAKLILQYLRKQRVVDSTKLAVLGWGHGGLTATLSAMLLEELKGVVSLDGREIHYYHQAISDVTFENLRSSKTFDPGKIKAHFLHIGSDHELQFLMEFDSIYSPLPQMQGSNYFVRFKGLNSSEMSAFNYWRGVKKLDAPKYNFMNIQYSLIYNFLNEAFNNDMPSFTEALETYLISEGSNIDLFLPQINYDTYEIRGIVMDRESKKPVSFPKISIANCDIGVLGTSSGLFRLNYLENEQKGLAIITAPGYETMRVPVEELWAQSKDSTAINISKKDLIVFKNDTIRNSSEVQVVGKERNTEHFSSGFIDPLKGQEVGVVFSLGSSPAYLQKIQFTLKSNSAQKIILRPNIYSVKENMPSDNITPDNIFMEITGGSGKFTIDLEDYNLLVSEDIFVSLELLEVVGNDSDISFTSRLSGEGTFMKNTWNSQWIKYNGLRPALELTVTYINHDER